MAAWCKAMAAAAPCALRAAGYTMGSQKATIQVKKVHIWAREALQPLFHQTFGAGRTGGA